MGSSQGGEKGGGGGVVVVDCLPDLPDPHLGCVYVLGVEGRREGSLMSGGREEQGGVDQRRAPDSGDLTSSSRQPPSSLARPLTALSALWENAKRAAGLDVALFILMVWLL